MLKTLDQNSGRTQPGEFVLKAKLHVLADAPCPNHGNLSRLGSEFSREQTRLKKPTFANWSQRAVTSEKHNSKQALSLPPTFSPKNDDATIQPNLMASENAPFPRGLSYCHSLKLQRVPQKKCQVGVSLFGP